MLQYFHNFLIKVIRYQKRYTNIEKNKIDKASIAAGLEKVNQDTNFTWLVPFIFLQPSSRPGVEHVAEDVCLYVKPT